MRALSTKAIGYLKDTFKKRDRKLTLLLILSQLNIQGRKWGMFEKDCLLLKIKAKSLRDGSQDICKDTESNLGLSRSKLDVRFGE